MHRMTWAALFMCIILSITKEFPALIKALKQPKVLAWSLLASLLVGLNWGIYIHAVNSGHVVETSFGYYINPLVSVAIGVLFFNERLRPMQTLAVGIAFIGVVYMLIGFGRLPYIALSLAFSFAFYGAVKKKISLSATQGMTAESGMLFFPALIYLLYLQTQGTAAFGVETKSSLLLAFGGALTAIPLIFFAAAAQRVNLSILGMCQYMAPTIQLVIGIYVLGEPFDQNQLIAFSFVWFALLIFTVEGLFHIRKQRRLG